ncbi:hypothetical protein NOF55_10570 [Rhizobiaceae bacterium BDR2-2]|uniref:Transmembrane protein (PGPGW) n=1 Tax=Ectorhizobium quercum TaxID=2965071 RepID=A0AAE3MZZ0_9HYPH|nr:hypothetical protein [Ectorhizobium quercum]MCX8997551.1 hypothetical protein [Ectorhizobium quercum]
MPEAKVKGRYRVNVETGRLELGRVALPVPRSRNARVAMGGGLVVGGLLGFLPVVGFWMFPVGLIVLSHDLPMVRRARRRVAVWWSRRRSEKA